MNEAAKIRFDEDHYLVINEARWAAVQALLPVLWSLGLNSAYDIGCGPGWFADKMHRLGLNVLGLEGRAEIADVARGRVHGPTFQVLDVDQDSAALSMPPRDFVLCLGLLYHIENPFRVVRALRSMTGKVMILETQCAPIEGPYFQLVAETPNETQGLTYHAVIPSVAAIVKMLSVAGFRHIYEVVNLVGHHDFIETDTRLRRRIMLVAADQPILDRNLREVDVPHAPKLVVEKLKG